MTGRPIRWNLRPRPCSGCFQFRIVDGDSRVTRRRIPFKIGIGLHVVGQIPCTCSRSNLANNRQIRPLETGRSHLSLHRCPGQCQGSKASTRALKACRGKEIEGYRGTAGEDTGQNNLPPLGRGVLPPRPYRSMRQPISLGIRFTWHVGNRKAQRAGQFAAGPVQ